jgi:hypothetical protein
MFNKILKCFVLQEVEIEDEVQRALDADEYVEAESEDEMELEVSFIL